MLCKGILSFTQFTVVIFWLSAMVNGKSSNSSTVTNETKKTLLSLPFPEDSKIFRYNKWKSRWPRKIDNPTNEILVTERNRQEKDNNVSSVSGPSPEAPINGTSKTLEKKATKSELSSSTDLMGGGGLSLYGITNSFVNPGHVLSASIENGLEKLSELVSSIGGETFQNMTPEVSPQFFGIGNPGDPEPFPAVSNPSYPNSQFGNVQNATVAQFFGIANIYIGDGGGPPDTSHCPECPPSNLCPSSSEHAILTVSVTECSSIASFGACSLASEAPTGTLFVLFPLELSRPRKLIQNYFRNKRKRKRFSTVSAVTIRIVASPDDAKLKVTCPSIPPGISVTTQSGSILPFNSREEIGYVQLKVSGNASSSNVAVACIWESES